jgi:hypothetical protein
MKRIVGLVCEILDFNGGKASYCIFWGLALLKWWVGIKVVLEDEGAVYY